MAQFLQSIHTVYSAWKLNNKMISIEYQSKFISKKDRSKPHYQNSLSLELRFKSGQSIKIPASIGSNSRTEKCLGTNVLILTSQPPPQKKNALLVRCRENLGSATYTWKTNILSFYVKQFDMIWEENIVTLWETARYSTRLKCFSPLPPSHTHTYPINLPHSSNQTFEVL